MRLMHLIPSSLDRLYWANLVALLLLSAVARPAEANVKARRADNEFVCRASYGQTCGAYSMYAALRLLGHHDASLDELISPTYIKTYRGSTAADLIDMAERYGVPALGISGWRLDQLHDLKNPVILEVKPSILSREYKHWVMVCPVDHGGLVMVDPPFEPKVVSDRDITSRWRGRGVLVGMDSQPMQLSSLFRVLTIPITALIVCVPGIYYVAKRCHGNGNHGVTATHYTARRAAMNQAAVLLILTIIAGVTFNLSDAFGLLRNYSASVGIQRANEAKFLGRVKYRDIQDEVHLGAILIDARRRPDYASGHLPGAINMPVGMDDDLRRGLCGAWPKEVRIIVYCQSIGCDYDEQVAASLVHDGYRNVLIYEGGWVEWQAHQEKNAPVSQ